MADLKTLAKEIALLEDIQAELAGISKRDDEARRGDLVQLRRKLSAPISKVGGIADPIFATIGDRELTETYRLKFSNMRSAAATHQANWPAVLLGERPDEYRASAQAVRDANQDFVTWIRRTMDRLGEGH